MAGVHHQNQVFKVSGGGGGSGGEDKVLMTFQEDSRVQDHLSWNDDGTKKHETHSFYRTPDIGKPRIYVSEAERQASIQRAKEGSGAHLETVNTTVHIGGDSAHVAHAHGDHSAHHDHDHAAAHEHPAHDHPAHDHSHDHATVHVQTTPHHTGVTTTTTTRTVHPQGYSTVHHTTKPATPRAKGGKAYDENCTKCAAEKSGHHSHGKGNKSGGHHYEQPTMSQLMSHQYARESQARRSREAEERHKRDSSLHGRSGLIRDTKSNVLRTAWNQATEWVDHPEMEKTRWNKASARSPSPENRWSNGHEEWDPKTGTYKTKLFRPEEHYDPEVNKYLQLNKPRGSSTNRSRVSSQGSPPSTRRNYYN